MNSCPPGGDESPFFWRPSVKRLPDKILTKLVFVRWVPTSDEEAATHGRRGRGLSGGDEYAIDTGASGTGAVTVVS